MKKIILSLFFGIFFISANAQTWHTNFKEAKEIASKKHEPIVLVFQGSDWCAPCIKLDKQVWSTGEFKKYAKDHYVMLQADFPKKKDHQLPQEQMEQNEKLAEKYNPHGYFPLVVVMDENGKVLGQTGYKNVSVDEFIDILDSFKS
ncbi:thioredoxin family protein [Christiangramia fulva]|uniref:Thioredoxin family protein n=1 Tax=Christiangramia fulva TaxID=2126553 RepID=A0A2R3Z8Z6_9FLAO|nr:thioredoxin family protein [Christiangramia fulva]AVR46746.1 thioredoxin family protein [Christiangramia fulva]